MGKQTLFRQTEPAKRIDYPETSFKKDEKTLSSPNILKAIIARHGPDSPISRIAARELEKLEKRNDITTGKKVQTLNGQG